MDVHAMYEELIGELKCPICMEFYENPKVLTCGHSICFKCIASISKHENGSDSIHCPKCRTVVPKNRLIASYALRDGCEIMKTFIERRASCTKCAKCRVPCKDEDLWICAECAADANIKLKLDEVQLARKFIEFAFCARCLLKQHKNHRYVQYSTFLKKCENAEKINKRLDMAISEMVFSSIAKSAKALTSEYLAGGLGEEETNRIAETFTSTFPEAIAKIATNVEDLLKDMTERARHNVTTTAERPTAVDEEIISHIIDEFRKRTGITASALEQHLNDLTLYEESNATTTAE